MAAGMSRAFLAGVLALLLAGCSGDPAPPSADPTEVPTAAEAGPDPDGGHAGDAGHPTPRSAPLRPLRTGERRVTMQMAQEYTPSAPTGVGTDDYRCFLLDPGLDEDSFITGTNVAPGNPDVVHHVILFRLPPAQVEEAERIDADVEGPGWTCFGDAGVRSPTDGLDSAPWLGAWAPGTAENIFREGLGVPLEAGSRIVMQVHYNLLEADTPDVSATQLRLAPGSSDVASVETMLLPAPVELPCRPAHADGPLCDREATTADVRARFGEVGALADLLHLLCGPVRPGEVQTCERPVRRPTTVVGVAGHMHLLGRELIIEVNPGTPRARTLLHIEPWDFDDQAADEVEPVRLGPGDTVRVTCRHVQWLRDRLPAFEGQPDRYVVWGEGTTDEMCLGILQVVRP